MNRPPEPTSSSARPPGAWDEVLALQRAGHIAEALARLDALAAGETAYARHPQARAIRAQLLADLALERGGRGARHEAADLLEKAVAEAPRFPDLHHRLGLARLAAGDRAGARRAFEEALRLAPQFAAPRLELALLDAREGRLAESLDLLRRLGDARRVRGAQEEEFRRALDHVAGADLERGGQALRRALGLERESADARLREVGLLLEDGRVGEAVGVARAVVEAHPLFPDAHLALALVRRARGEWDDCAEACGRALELNPRFHLARVYLAEALSRLGEWSAADQQLAAVLAAEPEHPFALTLARVLRRPSRAIGEAEPAARPAAH